MTVRSSMAALISRVRVLINDPAGSSQTFDDQTIQDVLDASRLNVRNVALASSPTFVVGTISYLDYYSDYGDWEDDLVLKQFLVNVVTPATSENIVGHWTFATTTLPPVYITGKTFDVYRASADLLERWAAKVALRFDFGMDGQNFRPSQMAQALLTLAKQYRMQQRAHVISVTRSDTANKPQSNLGLGPLEIDRMSSGNGR